MNQSIIAAIIVTFIAVLLVSYFFHIRKNTQKHAGKHVDCVTLQTGKYSLVASDSSVDAVVTIPLLKLTAGLVVNGKLILQYSDMSEQTVEKIFEYSREYQRKMNELFDKPK